MKWRLLPYTVNNPAWNMAVDEAIFTAYCNTEAPATLRFYGWDPPAVSIGYFQDLAREINIETIKKKGFGLVRRPTGGRAVLHDRELTYSVVAGVRDGLPESLGGSYHYIARAFAAAFQSFNIAAELQPETSAKAAQSGACFESPSWYELMVDGRKLVGSAQFRQQNSFLQHGSILLDFSAADLAEVLSLDGMDPERLQAILAQRVTSFTALKKAVTPPELAVAITRSFTGLYGVSFSETGLTAAETEHAQKLMEAKYANSVWTATRGKSGSGARIG
jgi:lipoate-protein ligase A